MHAYLAFMNLGPQEGILIFVLILLLFGAKKLPELAREDLERAWASSRKARQEFEDEITRAQDDIDISKKSS